MKNKWSDLHFWRRHNQKMIKLMDLKKGEYEFIDGKIEIKGKKADNENTGTNSARV